MGCGGPREIWVAKEDVSLFQFSGSNSNTKKFSKGTEFTVVAENADRYWEFQQIGWGCLGTRGFASRYKFFRKNSDTIEDQNPWYFGKLSRQEMKELLLNDANMDGAFLVRWSEAKYKFLLSMKHFDHHQEEWLIKN